MKRCSRCGESKDAADYFYRAAKSPDGYHWWCIRCLREYKRTPSQRAADHQRAIRRWSTKQHLEAAA